MQCSLNVIRHFVQFSLGGCKRFVSAYVIARLHHDEITNSLTSCTVMHYAASVLDSVVEKVNLIATGRRSSEQMAAYKAVDYAVRIVKY